MTFNTRNGVNGLVLLTGLLVAGALTACTRPQTQQEQDQQLRDQAAKTTVEVKQQARQAAAEAKVATAEAGREIKDIAAGVRDGLHDGSGSSSVISDSKPGAGRIDLNSASQDDLTTLPGIGASKAKQIIDSRPYGSSHDLVVKGILSESHYERIAHRVTAR